MRSHLLILATMMALLAPSMAQAQRAVILVRHAEQHADGSKDPALTPAGEERARRLASLLKDAGITAIYTSQLLRTIRTARPLSEQLGLEPRSVAAVGEDLAARVQADHRDDVVLIVGHSNTLPILLKAFGHPETITIAPDQFDNVFVVVPRVGGGAPAVVRLRY